VTDDECSFSASSPGSAVCFTCGMSNAFRTTSVEIARNNGETLWRVGRTSMSHVVSPGETHMECTLSAITKVMILSKSSLGRRGRASAVGEGIVGSLNLPVLNVVKAVMLERDKVRYQVVIGPGRPLVDHFPALPKGVLGFESLTRGWIGRSAAG
jgi:hypothetical protein